MHLAEHPLVQRNRHRQDLPAVPEQLDADWLKRVALDAGAADVGLVEIYRPELSDQRSDILAAFPAARTLVAFVCRVERDNLRSPSRSVVDLELSFASRETDEVARRIVRVLSSRGIREMNPPAHYPLETARWPEKMWVVAQKPVAVAAGLGRIGRHRLVVHPRFGAQVLLGTVLVDRPATGYDAPVAEDPCLECQLCVAACPVGAIGADGSFNALSCYVHSNRDRQGGFVDWVEKLANSRGFAEYRKSFSDAETVSLWQNLTAGSGYKSSSCMAVCPTGEDVIGPYLADRRAFLDTVLRPLRNKVEDVYVVPGGDAEASVIRRFPHKRVRRVRPGLRARTARGFLDALPILFQPGRARGLAATFHFTFLRRRADPGDGRRARPEDRREARPRRRTRSPRHRRQRHVARDSGKRAQRGLGAPSAQAAGARPDAAHEVLCGLLPSVNGGHVRGDRTTKRNKMGGTG